MAGQQPNLKREPTQHESDPDAWKLAGHELEEFNASRYPSFPSYHTFPPPSGNIINPRSAWNSNTVQVQYLSHGEGMPRRAAATVMDIDDFPFMTLQTELQYPTHPIPQPQQFHFGFDKSTSSSDAHTCIHPAASSWVGEGSKTSTTVPGTPNSSISSSSEESAVAKEAVKTGPEAERAIQEITAESEKKPSLSETKRQSKLVRKKGERNREPRFAFMTKSDVDHLEDGYRWRKYGQKAVKNSPYPRSYYRCTNSKCCVKKRVERSSEEPSTVITTYEGRHSHHSPAVLRGSEFQLPHFADLNFRLAPPPINTFQIATASIMLQPVDHSSTFDQGLLEDIVPPGMRKHP